MDNNTSTQQAYPGYGSFAIEDRNGYPQEPGAQWRIVAAAANEKMEDPAYPRYGRRHDSVEGAIAEIEERLKAERQRLLERAEGCLAQLNRMHLMYRRRQTPAEAIAEHREQLVDVLRRFKAGEKVGYPKFGCLSVALPYLHSKNIFVVSLPEYDPVNLRFLPADIELLRGIIEEAGFTSVNDWNGAGCYTVSFQLPLQQLAGCKEDIAEVA